MSKFVVINWDDTVATTLLQSLGVDETMVRRLVIDFQVGSPAMVYLETFADQEALSVSVPSPEIKIEGTG